VSQALEDQLLKKVSTLVNGAWVIATVAFAAATFVVKLEINQSAIESRVEELITRNRLNEGTINELKTVNARIDERLSALKLTVDHIERKLDK
jgi:hypothetical protein